MKLALSLPGMIVMISPYGLRERCANEADKEAEATDEAQEDKCSLIWASYAVAGAKKGRYEQSKNTEDKRGQHAPAENRVGQHDLVPLVYLPKRAKHAVIRIKHRARPHHFKGNETHLSKPPGAARSIYSAMMFPAAGIGSDPCFSLAHSIHCPCPVYAPISRDLEDAMSEVETLTKEISELRRLIAAQDRRIATLESKVDRLVQELRSVLSGNRPGIRG